jgi:Protein of unknown function DUF262
MADYFSAIVQRLRAKMDMLPSLVPPWITVMNRPEILSQKQWEENLDDIPAIDPDEDESIVQPFDPAKIRVETKPMSIDLLLQRIKHEELNLTPDFQRQSSLWKPVVQSRLIESILIRIPLPAFYMDATEEDKWTVIDGLQRLSTLKAFILDETLLLEGLEFLDQLNGKTYSELPRNYQRRIQETQITVYSIEKGTPPEVKFNIFKRINTGGLPLSSQEIRHALNQGQSTELLKDLADLPEFLKATTWSIPRDRMVDREFILRFLAFMITSPETYKSSEFDSFLNDTMQKINRMTSEEIDHLRRKFHNAMSAAIEIFDRDAFRKRYTEDSSRYPINKALFEAWSVNLAQVSSSEIEILKSRKSLLRKGFIKLMGHWKFENSITQGTGDTSRVKSRFGLINRLIRYCLQESPNQDFENFIENLADADEVKIST